MLKLVAYPTVLFCALLVMGHTKFPVIKIDSYAGQPYKKSILFAPPADTATYRVNDKKWDGYQVWKLGEAGLSEAAFNYAMQGYVYLNNANLIAKKNILSIVDFSKPSSQKRLYVIDIASGKILFKSLVAHGRNSGNEYATQFSNSPESHQSSLGFYITMATYQGGNGYSLRLKGCEKGINDNAYERAIVIHGADYVSERFISSRGEAGRSYGCPAIPVDISKKIIDAIKEGSCLFIYHPTKKYCSGSKILNS